MLYNLSHILGSVIHSINRCLIKDVNLYVKEYIKRFQCSGEKNERACLKLTTFIHGKAHCKGSRVSQWVKCSLKYPEGQWFWTGIVDLVMEGCMVSRTSKLQVEATNLQF